MVVPVVGDMRLGIPEIVLPTEISNRWPPTMMDSFRSSPRERTERVSAICSQKGELSQDVMPRVVYVALLITFTPDLPSTTHPCISVPCTRTLMTGLRWSMIVGSRLVSVNRDRMLLCGVYSRVSIPCRNQRTKFKSLLIVSVIGQSARASQIRSTCTMLLASGVPDTDSCRIRSMLAVLAFVTHS